MSFTANGMRVTAFLTSGLFLMALVAWLLIAATASAAVTYYVDPTGNDGNACTAPGAAACLTIQGAVNKATAGDTIQVAAGTYAENVTIPATHTGLIVNGAQAGVAVGGRTPVGPAESTVRGVTLTGNVAVIRVDASGVTIDGLSVTDPNVTAGAAFGIDVRSTGSGAVIKNNIVTAVITPDPGGNGTAQGIYLNQGPDNVQITNNLITNVHSNRSAKGVLIGDSAAANSSSGVVISGNTISSILSDTRGGYGVQVSNAAGVPSLTVQNNVFSTITGTTGWVHVVGLETNVPSVVVTGNSFSGITAGSAVDKSAVWIEAPDVSFPAGNINQNNFNFTNAFGIAVDPGTPAGSIDGTCNWWSSPSGPGPVGPGTGANVTPKVTYSPWLVAAAPGGACSGPLPTPNPNAVGGVAEVLTNDDAGTLSAQESSAGNPLWSNWLLLAGLAALAMICAASVALTRRQNN